MEKILHRSDKRGKGEHGWLSTRYSFSFADWYEPSRMGFGALRLINDDTIAPHSGFGMHPHKDMEIVTVVTSGTLTHQDSMGNVGVLRAGEAQVMSAGTGVVHAEYNDADEPLTLFQIWITPKALGTRPRYEEAAFESGGAHGRTLLAGPDGVQGALPIGQDAYISRAVFDSAEPMAYELHSATNGLYIFVTGGSVECAGEHLDDRDALGLVGAAHVDLVGRAGATALLFEVPLV